MQNSIVKISLNEKLLGVGVLIASNLVLTCAHVIKNANTDEFTLNFPLLNAPYNKNIFAVKLVNQNPSEYIDIAILEIKQPAGDFVASPAIFSSSENVKDKRFEAFGYPVGIPGGATAEGLIGNKQGFEWIEIKGINDYGYFVEPGFSGGGVYDRETDVCYGIINISARDKERRLACYIPINKIISDFPELGNKIKYSPLLKSIVIKNENIIADVNGNYILKGSGNDYIINNDIDDDELKLMIRNQQKLTEELLGILREKTDISSKELLTKIEINNVEILIEDATEDSLNKAIEKILNIVMKGTNTYTYIVNLKASFKNYRQKTLSGINTFGEFPEIIMRFINIINDYKQNI